MAQLSLASNYDHFLEKPTDYLKQVIFEAYSQNISSRYPVTNENGQYLTQANLFFEHEDFDNTYFLRLLKDKNLFEQFDLSAQFDEMTSNIIITAIPKSKQELPANCLITITLDYLDYLKVLKDLDLPEDLIKIPCLD